MTWLQLTPVGLLGVVAKGTLLLALGWCAALFLRRAPAGARHVVWLTVIVGVLLIPALAQIAPVSLPVLPRVAAPSAVTPTPAAQRAVVLESAPAVVPSSPVVQPPTAESRLMRMPSYASVAIALWLVVVVVLLGRLAIGLWSVARIIRGGRGVRSDDWTRALVDAADRLKLISMPRLIMSDQVEMAFASDAFTPTIIVPASAEEWPYDRRRAVLLHELAHVRRRDLIGHLIASVACAVYWFNPFVWAAARRLRLESELACDDVVLESGVRPSDYAQHLLDMVTSVGTGAPTLAVAMARPKEFEGRLVAILDRAKRRKALGRSQVAAMIGLLGLLTVSIAAVVPVPRVREIAQPIVVESPATAARSRAASAEPARKTNFVSSREKRGAPLSGVAIATLLRYGTAGVINPMMMILRTADSLQLTGKQADSIATLNRRYMIRLNTIWAPVSSYYVTHPEGTGETSSEEAFRAAPRASMDELMRIAPHVLNLLTPEQRGRLTARVAGYLDSRNLAAIGAGATSDPGGVFLIDGGGPGGRRGGAPGVGGYRGARGGR